MSILVVADIHSNLVAFKTVLEDAERAAGELDAVWSLGDLVGYGPEPNACIELMRSLPYVAIVGNHDLAAAGGIELDDFNPWAAVAALWTQDQLSTEERDWLLALPQVETRDDFTLAHGTLTDPVWRYMMKPEDAAEHLELQGTPYGFVGHTHHAALFRPVGPSCDREPLSHGDVYELDGGHFVANPGSVGQPRDGDSRAGYALVDLDAGRVQFRRVEYDIAATQAAMRAVHLPSYLTERLARGH